MFECFKAYVANIPKDESSARSNFVLQSYKHSTANTVKNNTETEKSEQTVFAQISLSQY